MYFTAFLPIVLAMSAIAAPLAAQSGTTPNGTPHGIDTTPNASETATNGGETSAMGDMVTVTKGWALAGLGSGTATLNCPDGYDVGTIFYIIDSSNSKISTLSGSTTNSHQTYGTAALTNWSLDHQTTTLSLKCYRD